MNSPARVIVMDSNSSALPYRSIPQMLMLHAERFRDQPAFSFKRRGAYQTLTYEDLYQRVLMAARGLRKTGVRPGDRVAILSENHIGWVVADLGIQCARGIGVPIYATSTAAEIAFMISHCEARIVFISGRTQYEKLLAVRDRIPAVELVVSFERFLGDRCLPVYSLYQLSEISHPITDPERRQIETEIQSISPDDLMSIVYTSGTTGTPKGVMLTQYNMTINAWSCLKYLPRVEKKGSFLSFLPLSHVLERTVGYHMVLMYGGHITLAERPETVVENILEVKPMAMISVPRLFEKVYSRIYETVHLMGPARRRLFHQAIAVGRDYIQRKYVDRQPTGRLGVEYGIYDRLVFRKIRQRFGGNLEFFVSGGAPLDKTVNEFMWIIGIPVFEGYGLTETSPVVAVNTPRNIRYGSVGRPIRNTEVRLADDGELLVRGPQVMKGYYRDEAATAAAFTDGWFKTGDIARIDEYGFISIIDRKKELIVTAGGKNIAPQPIENSLKLDKYISQACLYGDGKPYLVALLTPNLERLIKFAQEHAISYLGVDDLVTSQEVLDLFNQRLEKFNATLPPYQTIKRFALLPRDFSPAGGELTATLKLKRKTIYHRYQEKIEQLYQDISMRRQEVPDEGGRD